MTRTRWRTERRNAAHLTKGITKKTTTPDGFDDDNDDDDYAEEAPGAYAITATERRHARVLEETTQRRADRRESLNRNALRPPEFEDDVVVAAAATTTTAVAVATAQSGQDSLTVSSRTTTGQDHASGTFGPPTGASPLYTDPLHRWETNEKAADPDKPLNDKRNRSKWFILGCTLAVIAGSISVALVVSVKLNKKPAVPPNAGAEGFVDAILLQCETEDNITAPLPPFVRESYEVIRAHHSLQPYIPLSLEVGSCDAINLSLLWNAFQMSSDRSAVTNSELESARIENRFALAVLFASMNGQRWENAENWLSATSECQWFGISCYPNQPDVMSISLIDNNLKGRLDGSLGLLRNILKLELTNNAITGTMSSEMWGLRFIENLSLEGNKLSGSLPGQLANHAPLLKALRLDRNAISGALPDLSRMSHLVELSLREILCTGTFPSHNLDHLSSLEVLDLSGMRYVMGTLPSSIELMTNLRTLSLEGVTVLGTIPETIGNMHALEYINLGNSYLTGSLPTTLGSLTSLESLILFKQADSLFTGTIPSELSRCSEMKELVLNGNLFSGTLPPGFWNLTALASLDVSCTDVRGPFPCSNPSSAVYFDSTQPTDSFDCPCCVVARFACRDGKG